MFCNQIEHLVSYCLLVNGGVEVVSKVESVPCKLAPKVKQIGRNVTGVHCHGAQYEVAAYILSLRELEIPCFIRENVEARHRNLVLQR